MNPHRQHSRPALGLHAQRGAASPWIFAGFLAVAGFFFFTEHRAHLMGALPFALLALCALMHLFHGRLDHHGPGAGSDPESGAPVAVPLASIELSVSRQDATAPQSRQDT